MPHGLSETELAPTLRAFACDHWRVTSILAHGSADDPRFMVAWTRELDRDVLFERTGVDP